METDFKEIREPREKLDPQALKAWFLKGLIVGIFLLILPAVYFVHTASAWDLPILYGWFGLAAVILYILWASVIEPQLKMRYWRYEIRKEEIDIQRGIFIRKRTLIPMIRVQHVDTEHGPIMRLFGLATLIISTAATNHRIPALSQRKAKELRGEISDLAKVSDEDV